MGLDNGIYIKTNSKKLFSPAMYDWEYPEEDGTNSHHYEILYWRKWWGFRNEVIDYLGGKDCCGNPLSLEQLIDIRDIYNKFNDETFWDENAESIWDWDEVKENFEKDIKRFNYLIAYKQLSPSAEIYFYDSY